MIAGGHGNENPNANWMDSRGFLIFESFSSRIIQLNIFFVFRLLCILFNFYNGLSSDTPVDFYDIDGMDIDPSNS
jgi:hypothetical protein